MKLHAAFALFFLVACGPPSSTVAPERKPDAQALCKPKPDLAANANTAKPIDCNDNAARAASSLACDKGDAAGCYRIGMCFKQKVRGGPPITNATEREGTVVTAMIGLGAACERGHAVACREHADLFEQQKTEPWQAEKACADNTRACHLGDEQGCSLCVSCTQAAHQ